MSKLDARVAKLERDEPTSTGQYGLDVLDEASLRFLASVQIDERNKCADTASLAPDDMTRLDAIMQRLSGTNRVQ